MAADRATGSAAALNDRALSVRSDRAVLSRDAAGVDRAATSQRGAILTEDLAMGPASGTTGHGASSTASRDAAGVDRAATSQRGAILTEDLAMGPASGATGHGASSTASRGAAAEPGRRTATAAGLAAQACPASDGRSRHLGRRVAAHRGAIAAQDGAAALAADAKSSATRGTCASLTADADTCERARHVRCSSSVRGSAFACDQPRLTARAGAECCIATSTGEATNIARTSQLSACGETGLTAQAAASKSAASTKAALAS
jgi:hypothetical protein